MSIDLEKNKFCKDMLEKLKTDVLILESQIQKAASKNKSDYEKLQQMNEVIKSIKGEGFSVV